MTLVDFGVCVEAHPHARARVGWGGGGVWIIFTPGRALTATGLMQRGSLCSTEMVEARGGDGPSGPRTHDGDGMGCEQFVHTYEIAAPSCSLKC